MCKLLCKYTNSEINLHVKEYVSCGLRRCKFILVELYKVDSVCPEWSDELRGKKCKRKNLLGRSEKKKKVALVSGKHHV